LGGCCCCRVRPPCLSQSVRNAAATRNLIFQILLSAFLLPLYKILYSVAAGCFAWKLQHFGLFTLFFCSGHSRWLGASLGSCSTSVCPLCSSAPDTRGGDIQLRSTKLQRTILKVFSIFSCDPIILGVRYETVIQKAMK
jgi:hypothetical protein